MTDRHWHHQGHPIGYPMLLLNVPGQVIARQDYLRGSRIVLHKDKIEIVTTSVGEEEGVTVVVSVKLARRNRARVLDDGTARPDPTILRAMARAHEWRGWLEQDEVSSYRDIANKAEVDASYVQLLLPLAFLEPQITRELLDGRIRLAAALSNCCAEVSRLAGSNSERSSKLSRSEAGSINAASQLV